MKWASHNMVQIFKFSFHRVPMIKKILKAKTKQKPQPL